MWHVADCGIWLGKSHRDGVRVSWCHIGLVALFSPTHAIQTLHATLHPSLLDGTHCMLDPAVNL